jgi:16S rRNA A1518/A1519 N6-dimethyltransferase RsmA/KsgA/DIM1 with predicted DNA glycosylase/AP lyase activity
MRTHMYGVLDPGAGAGAVTARLLADGARVTAVDAAPAMAARLRQDCPAADAAVIDAREPRRHDLSRRWKILAPIGAKILHDLDWGGPQFSR